MGYVVFTTAKTENHARQWRKVRYAVVQGDTRWECESCAIEEKRKREIKINQINRLSLLGSGRDGRSGRTFGDFDPLDGFVVHHAGALFDELVALDTEIEDVCALHR